jgi:isochorismate synthase
MRAATSTLDQPIDLNDVARGDGWLFVRDRVGIAGRGIAWRGTADDVPAALAAIDGGSEALAIGVFDFAPGGPGDFVIPAVQVRKHPDGRCRLTVIDGADDALEAPRPHPSAAAFTIEPLTPIPRYLAAVATARDAVACGDLAKAVIARQVLVSCDEPIDVHAVLLRLKASFGSSYRYSFDGLIGASPELLIEVDGASVRCLPLAGTAPRSGDPHVDQQVAAALLDSVKDQVEHRVVIDMIHDTLLPWCSYLDEEPEPSIVAVANVQHLGTRMEGVLSDPRPSVLTLAQALSPTPALGGLPRTEALALIAEAEGFHRGRYGGTIGWVDSAGNGTFAVTIRCADFDADRRSAVLTAGGGIVARSEPLAELAETQAKLQAMLAAIVRP